MAKQATFVQDGNVVNYTAGADIAVGDIVPLTACCGVALVAIANGATGPIKLDGVYTFTTDTGAAWTAGQKIYWNDTDNKASATSSSNTPLGFATVAKTSAGTSCTVKLQGF